MPSVDTLDFVMESLALGHTVMDQRQVRPSGSRDDANAA